VIANDIDLSSSRPQRQRKGFVLPTSEYVIAVYGPDGRVVEVHDCRWHGGEKCSRTTTKAKHTGGGE